jgi:hypothetical protein
MTCCEIENDQSKCCCDCNGHCPCFDSEGICCDCWAIECVGDCEGECHCQQGN